MCRSINKCKRSGRMEAAGDQNLSQAGNFAIVSDETEKTTATTPSQLLNQEDGNVDKWQGLRYKNPPFCFHKIINYYNEAGGTRQHAGEGGRVFGTIDSCWLLRLLRLRRYKSHENSHYGTTKEPFFSFISSTRVATQFTVWLGFEE